MSLIPDTGLEYSVLEDMYEKVVHTFIPSYEKTNK